MLVVITSTGKLTGSSLAGESFNLSAELDQFMLIIVIWQAKVDLVSTLRDHITVVSVAVATDATGQVHVLLLDGLALSMDGAQIGVLKDTDKVGLGSFLNSEKSMRLEAELVVEVLADLADESLDGSAGKEHVS